jgi:tripartite-type tricarboxylate transporter receptor subunit TctC
VKTTRKARGHFLKKENPYSRGNNSLDSIHTKETTTMKFASGLNKALLLSLITVLAPLQASAQTYPAHPIRLVVGYGAGGGTDIIARLAAQHLSTRLGQPIIVENRPGAGGNIASEVVAKAAPDGYTLLLAPNTVTINPFLFTKIDVDVEKDLRGVGLIANSPIVLVTNPNSPFKNLSELIAYAKKNPGKVNYGTPGTGTPQHLAAELFKSMAGVDLVHVPYRGSTQSLSDLMAGHIQLVSAAINSAQPFIKADKLRGIAVADGKRVAALKDLPAIGEVVKGYEVAIWYGIMAPAKTPKEIITRLNQELAKAVASPEMAERMAAQGYEAVTGSADQMDATVRADLKKWGAVIKAAGIQPE